MNYLNLMDECLMNNNSILLKNELYFEGKKKEMVIRPLFLRNS